MYVCYLAPYITDDRKTNKPTERIAVAANPTTTLKKLTLHSALVIPRYLLANQPKRRRRKVQCAK